MAVAGFALALYLRTLAPGLLGGDSGEFQFAAWLGGFAHPTGYPLYLLLGRLWAHGFPFGDPAWRMNVFSALWGAVAVGLLYLLTFRVLQMTARPGWPVLVIRLLALLAATIFAVTPTFWSQAVVAEVYTLNAALIAAMLLALVTWTARGSLRPLYLAAFLFGLSLAHHRTTILWSPAIVVFLWLELRRKEAARRRILSLRPLAVLAILAALPLLFYLYIPLTAPQAPYIHVRVGADNTLELYKPTLAGFVNYVTGREFESEFRSITGALSQGMRSLQLLATELTGVGVGLGLIGLAWLARRSRPLFALTGLGFLALLIFNLFYGIGDIGVYYILLWALWSLWIALGVGGLIAAGEAVIVCKAGSASLPGGLSSHLIACLLPCLFAFLLPAYLLFVNFRQVDQSSNDEVRTLWQAILAQPIPEGAILVTNDRDEMMPLWYMQYVDGVRPDLTGLFPLIQLTPDWADVGATTASALRSGRPVWLIKEMPGLEVKFRLEQALNGANGPVGKLVRVLGAVTGQPPERPIGADFDGAVRLLGYDIRPEMMTPGITVTVGLHWQPLRPSGEDYTTFVHLVNADGRVVGASDHRPGGIYYPSRLWKPGETVIDTHVFTLASDLGRPPYALEAGLYTGDGDLHHLGQPQRIGMLGRMRPPDVIPPGLVDRLDTDFGDQIALRGYRNDQGGLSDSRLKLTLYWEALAAPQADYTMFVHMLDKDGKIVAQYDNQPLGGELPTRAWPPGYTVADAVILDLPASLPAGGYRLVAGLYDAATGIRLPINGGAGGDVATLGEITWPRR